VGRANSYLPDQADALEQAYHEAAARVGALSQTPLETHDGYWRDVLQVRLEVGELSLRAAQALVLHNGAKGYLRGAKAQRRLREAVFISIVTPAAKHLRKLLGEMGPHR
jgi:hypothetical protein